MCPLVVAMEGGKCLEIEDAVKLGNPMKCPLLMAMIKVVETEDPHAWCKNCARSDDH